jgi:hypothetical protein
MITKKETILPNSFVNINLGAASGIDTAYIIFGAKRGSQTEVGVMIVKNREDNTAWVEYNPVTDTYDETGFCGITPSVSISGGNVILRVSTSAVANNTTFRYGVLTLQLI